MKIAFLYIFFALIAIITNIITQDIILSLYNGKFDIWIAIIIGTTIGLITKYILDKNYIFNIKKTSNKYATSLFIPYTATGILTTAVFWSMEFGFYYMFGTKEMQYLGAIIGLSIGYIIKYHLDKHYVFGSPVLMQ